RVQPAGKWRLPTPAGLPVLQHSGNRRKQRNTPVLNHMPADIGDETPEAPVPEQIRKVGPPLIVQRIVGILAVKHNPARRGNGAVVLANPGKICRIPYWFGSVNRRIIPTGVNDLGA